MFKQSHSICCSPRGQNRINIKINIFRNVKSLKTLYPVFILLITLGVVAGCDFNSPGTDDHEEQQSEPYEGLIPAFQGPTYSDDYTSIFRWNDRSIWNLANFEW